MCNRQIIGVLLHHVNCVPDQNKAIEHLQAKRRQRSFIVIQSFFKQVIVRGRDKFGKIIQNFLHKLLLSLGNHIFTYLLFRLNRAVFLINNLFLLIIVAFCFFPGGFFIVSLYRPSIKPRSPTNPN